MNKAALKTRTRSNTTSSTQTSKPTRVEEDKEKRIQPRKSVPERLPSTASPPAERETKTPTRNSFLDVTDDDQSIPEVPNTESGRALDKLAAPVAAALIEDSDTDFQSAYSASPRGSYASSESGEKVDKPLLFSQTVPENHEDRFSAPPKTRRERVSSTATATVKREKSEPRLNHSTNQLPSRSRVATKV